MRWPLRPAQRRLDRGKRRRILVIAAHILQVRQKLLQRVAVIDPSSPLDAVRRALLQPLQTPLRKSHADHRDIERALFGQRVQGREDHLVGKIARHSEHHQRVGFRRSHQAPFPSAVFSLWPPNWKRIAERTLSAKSSAPCELKRSYRAALRIGAGTDSSMAALIVQRPSPESDTRPENPARSGLSSNAMAVRSSSHEAITLPRRHTSVISSSCMSYRYSSGCRIGAVSASSVRFSLPAFACFKMLSPSA